MHGQPTREEQRNQGGCRHHHVRWGLYLVEKRIFTSSAYEASILSFVNAEDGAAPRSLALACGNQRARQCRAACSWASFEPLVALRSALADAPTCHKVIALSELVRSLPAAWLARLRMWSAWSSRCDSVA